MECKENAFWPLPEVCDGGFNFVLTFRCDFSLPRSSCPTLERVAAVVRTGRRQCEHLLPPYELCSEASLLIPLCFLGADNSNFPVK